MPDGVRRPGDGDEGQVKRTVQHVGEEEEEREGEDRVWGASVVEGEDWREGQGGG